MCSIKISIFICICMLVNSSDAGLNKYAFHPQTSFCRSDFAMLIVPREVFFSTINSRYIVDVLDVYKNTRQAEKFIKNGLYISLTTMFGGFNFVLDNPYLITGNIMKHKAFTGKYAYIKSYDEVTPYLKFAFKALYPGGCPCEVRFCDSKRSCNRHRNANEFICPLDIRNKKNCYTNFGFCIRTSEWQRCDWFPTKELQHCLNGNK